MQCPLCRQANTQSIYDAGLTPIFQNKAYASQEQARRSACGPVELFACSNCSYVFNGHFNDGLMQYDGNYQNEQAHSPTFDRYLDSIIDLLLARGIKQHSKIIEVGCGKGTFLNKLWSRGLNAEGFDTAYEGDDPRVHREYFGEQHRGKPVDLVILRHTLEHIADPLDFLQGLAGLCPAKTQIYIEVPSFEWIIKKLAFWDIFYEHCNYFTRDSLSGMFEDAEFGLLFGEQYMYVLTSLDKLRETAQGSTTNLSGMQLQQELDRYREMVRQHAPLLVWGAGAKGATFANLTDPQATMISAIVDINTKKSGSCLAGSGHRIISPHQIKASGANAIFIMNENYQEEISAQLHELGLAEIKTYTLGQ